LDVHLKERHGEGELKEWRFNPKERVSYKFMRDLLLSKDLGRLSELPTNGMQFDG